VAGIVHDLVVTWAGTVMYPADISLSQYLSGSLRYFSLSNAAIYC
jgi:hypothetical protein